MNVAVIYFISRIFFFFFFSIVFFFLSNLHFFLVLDTNSLYHGGRGLMDKSYTVSFLLLLFLTVLGVSPMATQVRVV